MAIFLREGNLIDYIPSVAVDSGTAVAQGSLVGVATSPIAADALGSLTVEGVFLFDVEAGSGALAVGDVAYLDGQEATDDDTGNPRLGLVAAVQPGKVAVKINR